ncbi:hypothetical protein NY78_1864 [Desulfovibrio sp. TomC]|nr:hypothetical protein NY78_1864 [Desulfovibrio sp. TomC]
MSLIGTPPGQVMFWPGWMYEKPSGERTRLLDILLDIARDKINKTPHSIAI